MGIARAKNLSYIGEPFLLKFEGFIQAPATFETLIDNTFLNPAKNYRAYQVVVSCRFEGRWRVKKNGVVVGSGRTGPASPDSIFYFIPYLYLKKDDVIILEYCSRSGIPTNAVSIEAYIQAGEL